MAKKKTKKEAKIADKKSNRVLIEKKLEEALSDLRPIVGKKKFERRIRKAGKLLNKGIAKNSLDSLKKPNETGSSNNDVQDDTTILIEELP